MALLDAAIELIKSKSWNYAVRSEPVSMTITLVEEGDDKTSNIDGFLQGACRRIQSVRSVGTLIEHCQNVPEFSITPLIRSKIAAGSYDSLPEGLRTTAPFPLNSKMQVVMLNNHDGTMTLLKFYLFEKPVESKIIKWTTGALYVPVFRNGPWLMKKAMAHLFGRIEGVHVSWIDVAVIEKAERQNSHNQSNWNPTPDEMDAANVFLKDCTLDDSENAMTLWIWKAMRVDSGTPVAGWPELKIRRLVENFAKANHSSDPQYFYPLLVHDLHPIWWDAILPVVMPLFLTHGILLLGHPGIGKTPVFVVLAMAMGRYHVRCRGVVGKPGWKEGKAFDCFHNAPGQVQIPALLDDSPLDDHSHSDMLAFLEVGKQATTDARYQNAKFAPNQWRGIANNTFKEEDEPSANDDITVDPEIFLGMVARAFGNPKSVILLAIMKRCVTIVAGKLALYIRLPSKDSDALCFKTSEQDIAKDWLVNPGNKSALAAFKNGVKMEYDGFENNMKREADLVDATMEDVLGKLPEVIISEGNAALKIRFTALRNARWDAARAAEEALDGVSSDAPGPLHSNPDIVPPELAVPEEEMVVRRDRRGALEVPLMPRIAAGSYKRDRFAIDETPSQHARKRLARKTSVLAISTCMCPSHRECFLSSGLRSKHSKPLLFGSTLCLQNIFKVFFGI
jgi:hypothetical protein